MSPRPPLTRLNELWLDQLRGGGEVLSLQSRVRFPLARRPMPLAAALLLAIPSSGTVWAQSLSRLLDVSCFHHVPQQGSEPHVTEILKAPAPAWVPLLFSRPISLNRRFVRFRSCACPTLPERTVASKCLLQLSCRGPFAHDSAL